MVQVETESPRDMEQVGTEPLQSRRLRETRRASSPKGGAKYCGYFTLHANGMNTSPNFSMAYPSVMPEM